MDIYFDMDGTLANFYKVDGWLEDLMNENPRPYRIAKPLMNFNSLAKIIHVLQEQGHTVNIISWLSKNGSDDFNEKVSTVKRQWLKNHLKSVQFEQIIIVKYGTPKYLFGNGILFDDEINNRKAWVENGGIAYDVDNILNVLKSFKR